MKYNILVTIQHPTHGLMGSGYLLKDNTAENVAYYLNNIHNSGLRENGITVWNEDQLVHYGERLIGDSTVFFEVQEFPEQ